jgi:hypothetical protein
MILTQLVRAQDSYPPAGGQQFKSASHYYLKATSVAFFVFLLTSLFYQMIIINAPRHPSNLGKISIKTGQLF